MSHDTWLHRIARVIVLPLAKTPVTPNQVTSLRLLTGIGAATLLALGGNSCTRVGAAVFLLGALVVAVGVYHKARREETSGMLARWRARLGFGSD